MGKIGINKLANLEAKPVPSNDLLLLLAPLKFLDFSASLPNDHNGSRRMQFILYLVDVRT